MKQERKAKFNSQLDQERAQAERLLDEATAHVPEYHWSTPACGSCWRINHAGRPPGNPRGN
jgi:hypothetical protein